MTSEVTHLWVCDKKLFLELECQHKRNKQTKNANSQQNLAVLSAATDLENKII